MNSIRLIRFLFLPLSMLAQYPSISRRPIAQKISAFNSIFAVVFAIVLSIDGAALHAQDFYLHNGDSVTFYGDSITAQRFYTRDIQDFVATRYPNLQLTYHNAGVPGDKVTGGYAGDAAIRVARDVKPSDPTVLTVMFGMNDGDYVPPAPEIFAGYQEGYERLIAMLRAAAPRARIVLVENTPYDEVTHGTEFIGYMATTEQNAKAIPVLGRRESLPVVDAYSPVKELLERAEAADPSFASLLIPDRIHPSEPLHWVMAESIVRAWHIDPVVSEVTLSAASQAITHSTRTKVSGIQTHGRSLDWDQLDEALPLPFNLDNALMNFVLKNSDLASCDQEILKVGGLQSGEYTLTIDKRNVGTFSEAELSTGINLALLKTPMWEQARAYDAALERRSELEQADFVLRAETDLKDKAAAGRILSEGEAVFEQKAQSALRISTHHYILAPLSQTVAPKT